MRVIDYYFGEMQPKVAKKTSTIGRGNRIKLGNIGLGGNENDNRICKQARRIKKK